MQQMGFPPAEIARELATVPDGDFLVLEEAFPAFVLFTMAPWRLSLWNGARLGLDWAQAESLARALGVPWDAATITDLKTMENAVLALDSERQR